MGNTAAASLRPDVLGDLEGTTAFQAEEIRDYYRRFMKECQSGRMSLSLEDFKKIYVEFFPEGDAEKFAEHVFRSFDVDHNGSLDFREFLTGLNVQLKGSLEDKLNWAFQLYDINSCGKVSRDELLRMLKSIYNLKSGQLPKEDKVNPEQLCEHIFSSADLDRDGALSHQEFVNIALKSKTVQSLLKGTMVASSAALTEVGRDRSGSFDRLRERSGSTGSTGSQGKGKKKH